MKKYTHNYYKILNVNPTASLEEIKKAYHIKAKQNHPDVGGNPQSMKLINEAYEILSNETSRKEFDLWLLIISESSKTSQSSSQTSHQEETKKEKTNSPYLAAYVITLENKIIIKTINVNSLKFDFKKYMDEDGYLYGIEIISNGKTVTSLVYQDTWQKRIDEINKNTKKKNRHAKQESSKNKILDTFIQLIRRILSWFVLCLISFIVECIIGITISLSNNILTFLCGDSLSILFHIFYWPFFLSLFPYVKRYCGGFTVKISNAIKDTKVGNRYIIFPTLMVIQCLSMLIQGLHKSMSIADFSTLILNLYYYIKLISYGTNLKRVLKDFSK